MKTRDLFGVQMFVEGDPNGDDCVEVELSAVVNADECADVEAWVNVNGTLVEVPLTAKEHNEAREAVCKAWYDGQKD